MDRNSESRNWEERIMDLKVLLKKADQGGYAVRAFNYSDI